jgi:hypothetical protein
LLSIAASFDFEVEQMDVKTSFLHGVGPQPSFEETLVGFELFLDIDRLVEDGAPRER